MGEQLLPVHSPRLAMRFFLIVAIALVCLAEAKKGGKGKGKKPQKFSSEEMSSEEMSSKEMGDDEGMCADPMEMGALCMAGTDMGDKMMAAMAECFNMPEEMRKGKAGKGKKGKGGKGKGKGDKGGKGEKCPSFDDLMSKIEAETADERCMMEKMGWMDSGMNVMMDVMEADFGSLNPALTDRIDEQQVKMCANQTMDMMAKEGQMCASSYNDEEIETLETIGMHIAMAECSHKAFMKACGEYIKESFMGFMMEANAPAGK